MDDDQETYLLLLLADSNLPTGSFVASSGLESFVKHGFAASTPPLPTTVNYLRDSLDSYARSALPFISDAHRLVAAFLDAEDEDTENSIARLTELDNLYDAMTINHVARRASTAQGVALLTLYSKGFSRPPSLSAFSAVKPPSRIRQETRSALLLDKFKLLVRREEVHGHLPTCWGALTAALGLTLERSQYLHLFLHARSLLSASVRLNDIGPYGAQQILLHAVRPLVAAEAALSKEATTRLLATDPDEDEGALHGPANTWPLGEILAARHDLQHSRIFNS